jgi:PQQ-dependent catabolism-associated CXXCW motif protein
MTILRACACALAAFIQAAALSAADPPADHPAGTDNAVAPEEPADYWTGPINAPVPTTLAGATVTDTQTLSSLVKDGNVVLVEVSNLPHRPEKLAAGAVWLPKPHQVIPGSLWIPGAGVGNIAPDVDATYRDQLAHATNNDLERLIVVYCHERCWLSWNAAKRAVRYGYRNVHWYPDGIEGWTAAGLKSVIAEPAVGPFGNPTASGSQ